MRAHIDHVSLNVSDLSKSRSFYNSLLIFLEFEPHPAGGWVNDRNGIWINQVDQKYVSVPYHRKHIGMSHLAFRVSSRQDVDDFYTKFLLPKHVPVLYGGPKEYPEYKTGYYAVYFEDPDRIKLEMLHLSQK